MLQLEKNKDSSPIHASLYNVLGRRMWNDSWLNEARNSEYFIAMDKAWPAGLYVLQVRSGKKLATRLLHLR